MKTLHVILTFCTAALFAAPSLKAQVTSRTAPPNVPTWNENVGGQLAVLLNTETPATRERGLNLALQLAQDGAVDLSGAVPTLLKIYRTSEVEAERLAALATLHAVGDEEAMQRIRRNVAFERSERVQVAALGALSAYYGTDTFQQDAAVASLAVNLRDRAR